MRTHTITDEQVEAIKAAQKALKEYNDLTGMGLGFGSDGVLGGFLGIFTPKIPEGADGPYPMGLKALSDLDRLFGPITE